MPAVTLPDPPPSDGHVALRGWLRRDVPAITAACPDPEIPRWTLVPSPYLASHARDWLATVPAAFASGASAPLAIVDARDHGRLLGAISLNAIDWDARAAEVGYWVAAHARRRSVATRALRLLAAWSFGALGLRHLELRTDADNAASQAVAAAAGFAPAAAAVMTRSALQGHDLVIYARTRG